MNNETPQDLITLNLPEGYESLPTPSHADAGFFRLVWACLRTILGWFSIIAGNTGRTMTATEQIALAATQLKNKEPKIDIEKHKINTEKYAQPIPVYNTDRTQNIEGPITEKVDLKITIGDHVEILSFDVTNLGETEMFIGHEWLKKHNPDINWMTNDDDEEDDEIEPGDRILMVDIEHEIQIRAQENVSTGITIKAGKKKKDKSFEEIVPEHY
ncbi:hypothetical protein Moror_15137 [Moniliophthora roreri MCA 2997]|uniref:Uncharacterized protein n=1 Tax=Moniliophthora roreri (strain MCA 2997) TaxID=1381753 RepID=V2WYZ2_MONRO|nr:hypothetical protein Moror_15137 [Moniliophthora roreri MCA 2997]